MALISIELALGDSLQDAQTRNQEFCAYCGYFFYPFDLLFINIFAVTRFHNQNYHPFIVYFVD